MGHIIVLELQKSEASRSGNQGTQTELNPEPVKFANRCSKSGESALLLIGTERAELD